MKQKKKLIEVALPLDAINKAAAYEKMPGIGPHPRAKELFDRHKLPAFHDPFAGGGTLPLEAYASDLNPVAVLINKAMIEPPPSIWQTSATQRDFLSRRFWNRTGCPRAAHGHRFASVE